MGEWYTLFGIDDQSYEFPVTRGRFLDRAFVRKFMEAWNAHADEHGVPRVEHWRREFARPVTVGRTRRGFRVMA